MSEVKRYDIKYTGEGEFRAAMSDENGPLVSYSDYAELKADRDALAAENTSIKASVEMHAAGFKICPACSHQDECETDDVVWMVRETPATDAYLNSVRAEGVDMAVNELKELTQRSKSEAPKAAEHTHAAALYLMIIAAQLRAGEPS